MRGALRHRLPVVLQQRDFLLLWIALVAEAFGIQMIAVAVGWQVFSINHSAFDLGLIGLCEFLPLLLLALPAGHLADRLPRRLVFATALALGVCVTALLLVVTIAGAKQLWPFLVLAAASGVSAAIANPAARALGPSLVPFELIPSAMAWRSIAFQSGTVVGPALGGLLFALNEESVYVFAAVMLAIGVAALVAAREPDERLPGTKAPGLSSVLEGIRFIRRTPVMLGAISLDLFAVLFGGAIALLPLFAKQILHTGPLGLGVLRSAPAVGALLAAVMLARKPIRGNTGSTLLAVVAAFGVSMIVFGLSHNFALSLAALAVSGFVDMISVNIRATIPAVAAPNEVRGRVVAVEMVFISASNELGAFESGVVAALIGAVPAVVIGGAVTIALAGIWKWVFPDLARIDRIDELRPEPAGSPGAAV